MKGSGEPLATIIGEKAKKAELAAIFEQKQKAVPNPGAGSGIQAPKAASIKKHKAVPGAGAGLKSLAENLNRFK